jgi:hypothetical protein
MKKKIPGRNFRVFSLINESFILPDYYQISIKCIPVKNPLFKGMIIFP